MNWIEMVLALEVRALQERHHRWPSNRAGLLEARREVRLPTKVLARGGCGGGPRILRMILRMII